MDMINGLVGGLAEKLSFLPEMMRTPAVWVIIVFFVLFLLLVIFKVISGRGNTQQEFDMFSGGNQGGQTQGYNPMMGQQQPQNQGFNPYTGQPEMGNPMMGQPEMGNPMMGQPEMGNPMMGQHGSEGYEDYDVTPWLGLVALTAAIVIFSAIPVFGFHAPLFGTWAIKSVVTPIIPLFKGFSSGTCLIIFVILINFISFACLAGEAIRRGKDPFKMSAPGVMAVSVFLGLVWSLIFISVTTKNLPDFFSGITLPTQVSKTALDLSTNLSGIQNNPWVSFGLITGIVGLPFIFFNNWGSFGLYITRYFVVLYFATITANQIFPVTNLKIAPFAGITVLSQIIGKYGLNVDPKMINVYTGFFITILLILAVYEILENMLFDSFAYSIGHKKIKLSQWLFGILTITVFITPKVWFGAKLIFNTNTPDLTMIVVGSIVVIAVKWCDNYMLGLTSKGEINNLLLTGCSSFFLGIFKFFISVLSSAHLFQGAIQQMSAEINKWNHTKKNRTNPSSYNPTTVDVRPNNEYYLGQQSPPHGLPGGHDPNDSRF